MLQPMGAVPFFSCLALLLQLAVALPIRAPGIEILQIYTTCNIAQDRRELVAATSAASTREAVAAAAGGGGGGRWWWSGGQPRRSSGSSSSKTNTTMQVEALPSPGGGGADNDSSDFTNEAMGFGSKRVTWTPGERRR